MTTIDLYSGAGGWAEGLAPLGITDVIGVELNDDACATSLAAGHRVRQADVTYLDLRDFAGVTGLVGSPPCPSFSTAGKGLGKLDLPRILAHIARIRAAGRWSHYSREGWRDPRSALVLEPLRYALTLRPDWITLEQVPPVLPIWQAIAEVLRDHGWHVECGLLSAEQFGVPQTRKRAILAARRCLDPWCATVPSGCYDSAGLLPAPTHRKYRKGVDRAAGDQSLLPWVSMADALGWGLDDRPAWTVTGGGTGSGGGVEVFPNRDARARLAGVVAGQARNAGPGAQRDPRTLDDPSYTIRALGSGSHPSGVEWIYDRPSPTIVGNRRSEGGLLVGRQLGPDEERRDVGGHEGSVGLTSGHLAAVRVSVQEAAVLQSFRPDYPWQGAPTKQYLAVGNAIPPLLATAVVGRLTGAQGWQDICAGMFRRERAA